MSKRLEFSRKVRRAIIERAQGKCEACSAVLKKSEGEVDHILPDALGGLPVAANGRLLCRVCHASKTAADVKQIRKADRQRDRHIGAMKPPTIKIKSAGFAKKERKPKEPLPPLERRSLYTRGELLK